ncbi:hypothetical protein [Streptomyces sp. NPDC002205]
MSCPESRQPAEGARSWSSPPACAVVRISQAVAFEDAVVVLRAVID